MNGFTEEVDFLRDNERTAVFIDGANFYSSTSHLQLRVDYKKLFDLFKHNTDLMRIFYYTAVNDSENDPLRKLIDYLDYSGYTMVTKPMKEFTRDGVVYRKGNMDVDLAIDMLRIAPSVDHIVLMSGDGDFRRLVQEVQRVCRVTVISTPSATADELRRQCDQYVDLSDLRELIASTRAPRYVPREEAAS